MCNILIPFEKKFMVIANLYSNNQRTMATMNEELVNVDTKEDGEDDMHPEKIGSIDSGDEGSESKNRVQRFDMVLKHLHRLKSQMNNNSPSSDSLSKSSHSVPPQLKNKSMEDSMKDISDGRQSNVDINEVENIIGEERKISHIDNQNHPKSSGSLTSPIPPAFKELHKLQALKLLQQQNQQRSHYQNRERDRKQFPHQRFPQHFGGPLSNHPSHRHSPPLPLKLPPPMRHPFFNNHHPQPINQPNNHYYSNSNNAARNFPQPGYFSPPLSQRLSMQTSGPTSPTFPPVHQGDSGPNYPIPPPPLTRFPMPPGLMRALAPNLANLAPHMIQPLLDEAKNRLAVMQSRMGNEGPPGTLMYPPSEPPTSPPSNPHQGNKFSSLFPPMMKEVSMDWNNPMLSSAANFKSPNSSDVQNNPLEGCSSSFDTHKGMGNKNDMTVNNRKDKEVSLRSNFSGLEESFLPANDDGRLDFMGEEDDEDEIFLEEDVGVDDDEEVEEELENLGVDMNQMNGLEKEASKKTDALELDLKQYERKIHKIDDRLGNDSIEVDKNNGQNSLSRKRKRTASNEIDKAISPCDEDIDTCGGDKKSDKEPSSKDGNSKRIRNGSVSPTPSTGGLSPPLRESPGTPPLPQDGRMFPPPFAYKLLEVGNYSIIFLLSLLVQKNNDVKLISINHRINF